MNSEILHMRRNTETTMYLQVTASSGHCSVRSVAKICFNDFHIRFLVPIGESANVVFLNIGTEFVSVIATCFLIEFREF